MQKYYTVDFMTKKTKKNEGELNQYYIEDSHEAIVSKEIYEKAKEIIESRKKEPFSKYALSEICFCGHCGKKYKRTIWTNKKGEKKAVWRCSDRIRNGTKNCKDSVTLEEIDLYKKISNELNSNIENEKINQIVISNIKTFFKHSEVSDELAELNLLLETYKNEYKRTKLIDEKGLILQKIEIINEKIEILRKKLQKINICESCINTIESEKPLIIELNDSIMRRFIKSIYVYNKDNIVVKYIYSIEK